MTGPSAVFVLCAVAHVAGGSSPLWRGAAQAFPPAGRFEADTTVLVNEAARRDREVGYKIKAALDVAPVWSRDRDEFLLRFDLHAPKLHLRGKHVNAEFLPYESVLDSYPESTFYAHWKHGVIEAAYLDPEELVDVLNYKKSLISLFQFQSMDGEYNETDISGECQVYYETVSEEVFRKIKRGCDSDGEAAWSRRVTRYSAGAARHLHAEEVAVLGHKGEGLKARAWHALRAAPPPPLPAAAPAASLEAALRALPAHLRPGPLALPLPSSDVFDSPEYTSLDEALADNLEALQGEGAGAGGSAAAALAALRLLPSLRRAPAGALRALVRREALRPLLAGLCRALGLAGTRAALAAADDALHLRAPDPLLPHALTFLQAFALAAGPPAQESAILEVLRLGEEARARAVADSALLAAAAAARRRGDAAAAAAVKDALTLGLARCKEEECRRVRLQALGNLRCADTADLLAEHAGAGGDAEALAALDALAQAPREALLARHLQRLTNIALDDRASLQVRAAALDLVLEGRAALPAPLARVAAALQARGPHELRRLFWQRLHELAARRAPVRDLLAALHPALRTWHARAQALAGTSSVLRRDTRWRWAGRGAALDSVQVASGGLLRRGRVRLLPTDPAGLADTTDTADDDEIVAVELWTRGLEAIAGGESAAKEGGDGAGEAEGVAGGLAISVAGARMRGVSLFDGQAELLGHVWAGAGSEPTPALRALVEGRGARGRLPLLAGAVLAYRARSAVALAIDAHVQVSLWWRTARAGLEVRGAAAGEVEAALAIAWGGARARALAAAEPRLRIAADLDFYDKVALCVRARTEDHQLSRNVTLQSECGARRAAVRRARSLRAAAAGRTLSLGAENDRACRTLRAADDDEAGPQ